MKDRLFIGCFPTGLVYCDTAIEEHGDYKRLGYLNYRTLVLELDAPNSPLADQVRKHAAEMQARRGERFSIAGNVTITLGQGGL